MHSVKLNEIRNLTDQDLLEAISLRSPHYTKRLAAAACIASEEVLERLAMTDDHWRVRLSVLRRLTNKDVLFKVATSDPEGRVRYAAAGCYYKVMGGFDAKGVMRAVHMREYLLAATEAAIKGVKSQAKLKKLARDYKDPEIRAVALTNLTDMATLAEILLGETDDRVRRAALDRGRILFGDQYC
jgi:hypothetical protein